MRNIVTILVGVIAFVAVYLGATFSSLPEIVDRFPPDLEQMKKSDKTNTKEFARFISEQNPNITLFEIFQKTTKKVPKDATVVIHHGWAEHSGRYDELADILSENGYNVYRFDMRGHGYSSGQLGYFTLEEVHADLEQVLSERVVMYVKPILRSAENPHKVFVLGLSMGGFIASTYEIFNQGYDALFKKSVPAPFVFSGLILSNPALMLGEDITNATTYPLAKLALPVLAKLLPSLPVQPALSSKYLSRDPNKNKEYESDVRIYKGPFIAAMSYKMLKYYARLEKENLYSKVTVPLLVLVSTEDKTTNPKGGIKLYENASNVDKELKIYEGYYHELFQEPERKQVMNYVVQWLDKHCNVQS
jgi:acylglycerol lipase